MSDDDIAVANAAIKLDPSLLLPIGTVLEVPSGEWLVVLYTVDGGAWTIVNIYKDKRDGNFRRESRNTARLYRYAEIVELPRDVPLERWGRREGGG